MPKIYIRKVPICDELCVVGLLWNSFGIRKKKITLFLIGCQYPIFTPKSYAEKITRKIEEIFAALALPSYMIITSRGNIAAM